MSRRAGGAGDEDGGLRWAREGAESFARQRVRRGERVCFPKNVAPRALSKTRLIRSNVRARPRLARAKLKLNQISAAT